MPRDAEGSSSRAQARLRACTSSKKMGKKKAAPPPPPPDDDDDDGPDLGFSLAGDGSDDDNDEKPSEAPAASEKNAESKAADSSTTTTSEPDRAALLKKHRQEEQQIRADAKQKLATVHSDAMMLVQILTNLGQNAARFTTTGFVEIGVELGGGGGGGPAGAPAPRRSQILPATSAAVVRFFVRDPSRPSIASTLARSSSASFSRSARISSSAFS